MSLSVGSSVDRGMREIACQHINFIIFRDKNIPHLNHLHESVDEDVSDALELDLSVFDGSDGGVVGKEEVAQKSQTPRQSRRRA